VVGLMKPCVEAGGCVMITFKQSDSRHSKEAALSPELSQLIALQETDTEIKRLKEEITSLPARQEQLERQFAESVKEHLALKQDLDQTQADRRRIEDDLNAEQRKFQKFKDDLMKATNSKEYETAVREIDVAKKAISSFETEVLKLMEKGEKLEAEFNTRAPEMEARRQEVDRLIAEYVAGVETSQQRLETLIAERNRLLEALAPQARATYERVSRMRSGLVLAEARDYSCMACRMKIRPQVFTEIRRGNAVITCESCGRILYFKSEPALT
jgi:predicted  nucleic acid-binding Zn-ribbon protein